MRLYFSRVVLFGFTDFLCNDFLKFVVELALASQMSVLFLFDQVENRLSYPGFIVVMYFACLCRDAEVCAEFYIIRDNFSLRVDTIIRGNQIFPDGGVKTGEQVITVFFGVYAFVDNLRFQFRLGYIVRYKMHDEVVQSSEFCKLVALVVGIFNSSVAFVECLIIPRRFLHY